MIKRLKIVVLTLMAILLTSLLIIIVAEASERAAINTKCVGELLGKPKEIYTFYPGTVVNIIKTAGNQVLIESDQEPWNTPGGAWVPLNNLSRIQDFTPVTKWDGEKHLEDSAGDYEIYVDFSKQGGYNLKTFDADGKTIFEKGKLHRHRNILLLVRDGNSSKDSLYQQNAVLIRNDGSLCPTRDPELCSLSP